MAPKRTTKSTPATTTNHVTTTSVTNAQLKAMIDQGVTDALAAIVSADKNINGALTWWNSHVRTVGHDVANWHYCVLECFLKSQIRLRDMSMVFLTIHGSIVASKPKTMQDAIEMATELMDNKVRTFAERQTENKRKQDDNQQQQQHQQNKRQNTGRAYTAGSGEKKPYGGSKPLSPANANTGNNQRGTRAETEDKSEKKRLEDVSIHGHLIDRLLRRVVRTSEMKELARPTKELSAKVLYKAQFPALGSFDLIYQEEGWIVLNVHRLPRAEQVDGKESLSTIILPHLKKTRPQVCLTRPLYS
ncbi:hypothetical protein Tco_1142901 [Tanacetum coccineum]